MSELEKEILIRIIEFGFCFFLGVLVGVVWEYFAEKKELQQK